MIAKSLQSSALCLKAALKFFLVVEKQTLETPSLLLSVFWKEVIIFVVMVYGETLPEKLM